MYSQYPAALDQATKQLLTDGAKLSQMAYSTPDALAKSKESFEILKRVQGTPQYVTCPECDAQCYLVKYQAPAVDGLPKSVLAICARGTTSLLDWMCDADVDQVPFKDVNQHVVGKVHAGFYKQFVGLFSLFDKQVRKHLDDGGTLLCVGHSLGSAVAVIASVNYALGYPGKVWYAGYGTPRALNPVLAQACDKNVLGRWRVKNQADPVDSCVIPINYTHIGTEIHLGSKDPCPNVPVLLHVPDHDIATYVAHLENPSQQTDVKSAVARNWLQTMFAPTKVNGLFV